MGHACHCLCLTQLSLSHVGSRTQWSGPLAVPRRPFCHEADHDAPAFFSGGQVEGTEENDLFNGSSGLSLLFVEETVCLRGGSCFLRGRVLCFRSVCSHPQSRSLATALQDVRRASRWIQVSAFSRRLLQAESLEMDSKEFLQHTAHQDQRRHSGSQSSISQCREQGRVLDPSHRRAQNADMFFTLRSRGCMARRECRIFSSSRRRGAFHANTG